MKRAHLWLLLRLVVSAGLVAFLFTRLSWSHLQGAFTSPHWGWLAGAVLLFALSALGGALQWGMILRAAGIGAPARALVRLYFVGLFFNNFLPANVGGDAVKIVDLGRREGRSFTVFCATLLDRILGLCALTLIALVAAALAMARALALPPMTPLLLAMVLWLGILALLLSRRLGALAAAVLERVGWSGGADRIRQFQEEFRLFRTRIRWLAGVFLLAFAVQTLRVATHVMTAWGLGLSLGGGGALQVFVLVPLLGVAIALPLSINGIGVREALSANLFVTTGVVSRGELAVGLEFAAYLVQVAVSLVGGVIFLMGRRRTQRTPAAASGA